MFSPIFSIILASSFEPNVNIILLSTNVSTSCSIAVDDNISISSFIPASLNFIASSTVETAKNDIPLSIKNLVYSTIPNPYPFAFTTAIIFNEFPLSSFSVLLAYFFICFILWLKSFLLITKVFNFFSLMPF